MLLRNTHQTEDITSDDLAVTRGQAHDLTGISDLVLLDGFCLLGYRLQVRLAWGCGKRQGLPFW